MPAAKQQIRQIIAENDISSVADVYTLLKDSFKDYPAGTYGGRTGCHPGISKEPERGHTHR